MSNISRTTDVVIVGGGVIGLSSAYRLAREGVRVTLLERGLCGQEASWAGAGVLQCGSWHRTDGLVRLLRKSLLQYPDFAAELHEQSGIDPQHIPCGSFELLLDEQRHDMAVRAVKAAEHYHAQFGQTVLELLSPMQAREQEPHISEELLGAKSCPVTSQVRNPLLLKALRAACVRMSVEIVEQCPVQEFLRDDERVVGVRSKQGDFSCAHVVLAAGAWSSLIESFLEQKTPVYPVRGQIVLLEMQPRPFTHIIEQGDCYLVPRLDGRIVVGATEEHDSGYEKINTAAGIHQLLTLAQRLVPRLAGATILRTWSGLRPGTPDRRPFIGPVPGTEGLLAATGHFRFGLVLAPMTAKIIADLIVRGETEHDLARCAPGREITALSQSSREAEGSRPADRSERPTHRRAN